MDPLTVIDMEFIASTLFPAIDKNIVKKMVAFNNQVSTYVHSLFFIFLAYLNHCFLNMEYLPHYQSLQLM